MKTLLILIISFSIFSCNFLQKDNNQEKDTINKDLIVGKWSLSKEETNGTILHCNGCPKVEFAKNNVGKIVEGVKDEISFSYILLPKSVSVEFSIDTSYQYFKEKKYYYKIYIKDSLETLELSSKNRNKIYILTKKPLLEVVL